MQKFCVLALFDIQAGAFAPPFFVPARNVGVRHVSDVVNSPPDPADPAPIARHPEDYRVFELGFFSDDTGAFELHDSPVFVVEVSTLKQGGGVRSTEVRRHD